MKPRLVKSGGLWYCLSIEVMGYGIGYTAEQAYDDWANR